jgi:hypothetical protein
MRDIVQFAKGQRDCRDGKESASKDKDYLAGYGFQYEVQERLTKGVYKS